MPTMATLKKASEKTGVSYSCLRRWILEGKFQFFVKSGSKYLLNLEKLEEYLNTPADLR